VLVDLPVSIAIGAKAGAPRCPDCGGPTAWIPQVGRMDAYEPFQEFDTLDGRNRPVHIDSLHKLRQVEREAEALTRDGAGQPMIWRRYSQDQSNRDQHTLAPSLDGGTHPTPEAKHRFGSTKQTYAEDPERPYGPGVSEANASALPDAPRGS